MSDITTRQLGKEVEDMALDYLQAHGLQYIDSNFNTNVGEIDLIMRENNDVIVFVEVRFRQSNSYGGALASVSKNKQNRIIRTAKLYLLQEKLYDKVYCRFDVITSETINNTLHIEWYKNAFTENFI